MDAAVDNVADLGLDVGAVAAAHQGFGGGGRLGAGDNWLAAIGVFAAGAAGAEFVHGISSKFS